MSKEDLSDHKLFVAYIHSDEGYQVDAVCRLLEGVCDFAMACTRPDSHVVVSKEKVLELLKDVKIYDGKTPISMMSNIE